MSQERVPSVRVNERPFVAVFVHNAARKREREKEYQPGSRKRNYTRTGDGVRQRDSRSRGPCGLT